jgi:hypothetical protein
MIKIFIYGIVIFIINLNELYAQSYDLTSVDEFFKVAGILKEGKEISNVQWDNFDNSACYRNYSKRQDKFVINTIKNSIIIVFGSSHNSELDSILSITEKDMERDIKLLFKKELLTNYLSVKSNYDSIKSFRENYDFNNLVEKSKQRLGSFLGQPLDSSIILNPVYFLFITADGKNNEEAIYVDFNLIYKKTEQQRIDFIAHEMFHNYRAYFRNYDFIHSSDLNSALDMIQDEGIADLIDKKIGYNNYFIENGELTELGEIFVKLYSQAPTDLERFQSVILDYSKDKITETKMIDEIIEIVKFGGHPIGFYMANKIVSAGYQEQMLITFYNPYEFFRLYNKAAKEQNGFQLSDEFMNYLNEITKEYYR